MSQRVIVTGAVGRVGSVTASHLRERGHEVIATDVRPSDDPAAPVDVLDLVDTQAVHDWIAAARADAIVHLGNHPAPQPRLGEARVYNNNVAMNMNVFQAAHDLGIAKIVFASTIQVICSQPLPEGQRRPVEVAYLPLDGDTPPSPGNSYGLSKLASEQMLDYFEAIGPLEAVSLRFPALPDGPPDERRRSRLGPDKVGQGFAWLARRDAARLIAAVLDSSLPGHRRYLPAAAAPNSDEPVDRLLERHYQGVPRRKEPLDRLVDISRIEADTGWTPVEGNERP
ncbi:MAG: NAD(P)-dependent oxidoreductase [Phycisphaeraceae bacterium]